MPLSNGIPTRQSSHLSKRVSALGHDNSITDDAAANDADQRPRHLVASILRPAFLLRFAGLWRIQPRRCTACVCHGAGAGWSQESAVEGRIEVRDNERMWWREREREKTEREIKTERWRKRDKEREKERRDGKEKNRQSK